MQPLRTNVLALALMGYATVLAVYLTLVWSGGMSAAEAADIVDGHLMALIGGSVAIAKDLVGPKD